MNDIHHNLLHIRQRIASACAKAGRNTRDVKLLLATKTVPPEKIIPLLSKGETLIGENKVQELKEKYDLLRSFPHQKHFIGHLQTNKIKEILKYDVTCIQSLDRIALAEKLHRRLMISEKKLDVFIQVNTSGETSKFGIHPEQTLALVRQVASLDTLQIKGLMTIGLFTGEAARIRSCFRLLRSLQQEIMRLQIENTDVRELSMGMSGDLEIAIEEGATIVRIGTAIFGKRQHPDSYYWNENRDISAG